MNGTLKSNKKERRLPKYIPGFFNGATFALSSLTGQIGSSVRLG